MSCRTVCVERMVSVDTPHTVFGAAGHDDRAPIGLWNAQLARVAPLQERKVLHIDNRHDNLLRKETQLYYFIIS